MRAAWVGVILLAVLFALTALAFGVAGALTASNRLQDVCGVFAISAAVSGGLAALPFLFDEIPARSLPRADRKRLAAEERRIRFEAEIRRLEREVEQ